MKITKYETLSMIERGEISVEDGLRLLESCDARVCAPRWAAPCGGFAMDVKGSIR